MNIYDFIITIINKNLDKFTNNIIIELDNILDTNLIIKNISKTLLCKNNIKFCNICKNCNLINLNINNDILIINNDINHEYFNDLNYIEYIINNNIYLLPINYEFKLIFICNIDLIVYKIENFILKKINECIKYIKFIFICNNIKKISLYFRINFFLLKIENNDINFNFNILKNIFNNLSNKCIITSLNLSNNSIIKSYFILNINNWNKRLNFINLFKLNFIKNKSLLFILNIINFSEIEIYNPVFWLLTFISDSIKYKNNFNTCIKNIDSIDNIKILSNLFSFNILNTILNKLVEYFYIINKNINIDKSFVLMKNILYIENIIK